MDVSEKICRKTLVEDVLDRHGVKTLIKEYQCEIFMACHIVYGTPYCNDAKEGVGGITPPKLNRGG